MRGKQTNTFPIVLVTCMASVLIGGLITYTLMKKAENPIEDVRNDLNLIRLTLLLGLIAIGGLMIYGATN